MALGSFATFVLAQGGILDSQTAFVALTLFNNLRGPLFLLPFGTVAIIQGLVAVGRINRFLFADEVDETSISRRNDTPYPISLDHASFTWGKPEENQVQLRDINLKVDRGSLIAVVGTVGCGKSSLLSALLGNMTRLEGEANVRGKESIAYVPQQAWMQNTSLRNNILFGQTYQRQFYDKVVAACALIPDLEILAGGDRTEIGEKGINVSGGQKQRISLARAVYNQASVYLLDDPLSAVDAHVGKHIFEKVIGPEGMLSTKTRILVTHAISYLPQMDHIIVMKDGKFSEVGTYDELLQSGGDFADFLIEQLQNEMDNEDIESESDLEALKHQLEETLGRQDVKEKLKAAADATKKKRLKTDSIGSLSDDDAVDTPRRRYSVYSTSGLARQISEDVDFETKSSKFSTKSGPSKATLIEDETTQVNRVKFDIYIYYAKSVGYLMSLAGAFCYGVFQVFIVTGNIWLSMWSEDPEAVTDASVRNRYLILYGVFGLMQSVFLFAGLIFLTIGTLRASITLHNDMLKHILSSTMAFFDTTPLGRIINRFSKDMDEVDLMIPANIKDIMTDGFNVLGTLFILIYSSPILIVIIIPLMGFLGVVQARYLAASRQVKRMVSVTRSPINSSLTESFSGAATIKAFKMEDWFVKANEDKIELNQKFYYPEVVSGSWLFSRLETSVNILIVAVVIFAVVFRDSVDPGLIGLSLTYGFNFQLDVFFVTRFGVFFATRIFDRILIVFSMQENSGFGKIDCQR